MAPERLEQARNTAKGNGRLSLAISSVVALAVFAGVFALIRSGSRGQVESEASPVVEERMRAIDAELGETGSHPWAGQYFYGDGQSANLTMRIAPRSGFAYVWQGCLGLYDENFGGVIEQNGIIHLMPRLPKNPHGIRQQATHLIQVRWGPRRYLVSTAEVAGFCRAVKQGSEPRDRAQGWFYLAEDDWTKPVAGEPELPKFHRRYLLEKPIVAEIVAVGESFLRPGVGVTLRETTVTLNAGERNGVFPELVFRSKERPYLEATVIDVSESTCEAEITQFGEDDSPPAIGTMLTAGPQDEIP